MKILALWSAAIVLVTGAAALSAEPVSDAAAIQQLARSGVDLSKAQRLEFLLRFPVADDAVQAAGRLDELAFQTTTEHDDTNDTWVVLATKVMHPVESDLVGLRAQLNAVAKDGHGTYEGWQPKAKID